MSERERVNEAGPNERATTVLLVVLVFMTVLTGTLLIPAARPFFALRHPENMGGLHAFMSINMLGGALGAPLLAWAADRSGRRRRLALIALIFDGLLMLVCSLPLPLWLVLPLRFAQGAASVSALSILMGALAARVKQRVHGGSMGLASAAVVSAIAFGAPLGTVCVKQGPLAALYVSAGVSLVAAALVLLLARDHVIVRGPRAPLRLADSAELRLAALFVTLERFAVGTFVVTFSLYAHSALNKTDAQVGMLYSAFLLPFAFFSAVAGWLLKHVAREALIVGGGVVYGACIMAFGQTDGVGLLLALFVGGVASAMIYAPALCIGAAAVPEATRSTAMGLINAGGTLGMMSGTALAGLAVTALTGAGLSAVSAQRWIFVASGVLVLVSFLAALRPLLRASAASR